MILIDKILVDDKIGITHFDCDLKKCKGACCTFPGEYGAPVLDEEIELIKESLSAAMEYLSEKSISIIENEGFIQGDDGHYTTMCINKRDCVFVYYEDDIALCALERAYRDNKTTFKKPVSCHLFPIRVGDYNGTYLYYERIPECSPALVNGLKKNVHIYESVKEAIIRTFGEKWYENYIKSIQLKV
jgi:hypothetical protein